MKLSQYFQYALDAYMIVDAVGNEFSAGCAHFIKKQERRAAISLCCDLMCTRRERFRPHRRLHPFDMHARTRSAQTCTENDSISSASDLLFRLMHSPRGLFPTDVQEKLHLSEAANYWLFVLPLVS